MSNKGLSVAALSAVLGVSSPVSADVPSPTSYEVRDTISGNVHSVTNNSSGNGTIPLSQELRIGNTQIIIDGGLSGSKGSPKRYHLGVTLIPTETPFVFKIDGERSSLVEKALIAAGYTISDKGYVLLGASQVREYNDVYQKNINGGSIFGKGVINLDNGTVYLDLAKQNVQGIELSKSVHNNTSTQNKDFTNYTEQTTTSVDTTTTTEGKGNSWMYTRAGLTHDIGDQSRIDLHYLQLDQQRGWGAGVKNWFPDQSASLNTTYEHDGFGNPISLELQKGISQHVSLGGFVRGNTHGKPDTAVGATLTYGFGAGDYRRPDTARSQASEAAHTLSTADGVVPSDLFSKLDIVTTSVDHIVSQNVIKIDKAPKLSVDTNSVIINADHTVTFTVNSDLPDVSYSYRVDGGNISTPTQNKTLITGVLSEGDHTIDLYGKNGSVTSHIQVLINVPHINRAPVATGMSVDTAYNTPITINPLSGASDPDGDTLSIAGSPTSADGTITQNPDGTLTFTPHDGFSGTTMISVIVTDGKGGNTPEAITVHVGTKPMSYTDAPTTILLDATNITSSSLLAQCNITDLDGANGTCVLKDSSGTIVHQSQIGADVSIQNLLPNTIYTLEVTGTANKKNPDGTLIPQQIDKTTTVQTTALPTPLDPTVSFMSSSVTKNVGDTFSQTLITNSTGTITYSSSDTSLATVDASGKVTIIASGNVTITASQLADGKYKAITKSYTIDIIAPNLSGPTLSIPTVECLGAYNPSPGLMACSTDLGDVTLTGFMANDPNGLGSYTIVSSIFGTLASGTGALPSSVLIPGAEILGRYGQDDTITITSTDTHPTNPKTSVQTAILQLR